MFGRISFTAAESFDAILGDAVRTDLRRRRARRACRGADCSSTSARGDSTAKASARSSSTNEVIPLGIPVDVTVTPIEISAGWRFRVRQLPKLIPYVAGGLTSMRYQETSDFATPAEDVDETFNGYHVLGGAEYKITRWLGVAGEASWTTVPDAIGEAGVSEAFNETDLGGTTFRLKITIGR